VAAADGEYGDKLAVAVNGQAPWVVEVVCVFAVLLGEGGVGLEALAGWRGA
jgi:hypothetical protein